MDDYVEIYDPLSNRIAELIALVKAYNECAPEMTGIVLKAASDIGNTITELTHNKKNKATLVEYPGGKH